MKKLLLAAALLCGTLPLAACYYDPYHDGYRDHPYHDDAYCDHHHDDDGDHHGYYDRVGSHGGYDANRDTPDGYYR